MWLDRILSRLFPRFDIKQNGDVYMRRWFVMGYNPYDGKDANRRSIFIHRTFKSDADLDPHDHSFNFVTFVLWNGYIDQRWRIVNGRPEIEAEEEVFSPAVRYRRAEHTHRLILPPGVESWSIVFAGKKVKPWGFWTKGGWVPWRKYLGLDNTDNAE